MITTETDFEFTDMGQEVPRFCHGCSGELNSAQPFVRWAFQGPMLTRNARALCPDTNPQGAIDQIEMESVAAVLGDCSEDGPRINLCWSCALKIGRDILEDGALCRYAHGKYPHQNRTGKENHDE